MNLFGAYMMHQVCKFQCLQQFDFESEDIEKVLERKYEALEGRTHDIPEQYHISKEFVAYFETLLWATPYWRGDDPRLLQNLYEVYFIQLKRYNKVDYKTFHKHIAKAMKDWQKHFPKLQAVKKVTVVPPKEHMKKRTKKR